MKKKLYILLDNKPGVLSRIIGIFSQRGYNIEKIIVKPFKKNRKISEALIKLKNSKNITNQIKKKLLGLINISHVKIIKKK
ncbi:acetolactate synthase small subunit [Buchnera aphidicola (Ceratoglyphina bambusae)]|uniref:acetolactate synthase small subunit n=1 Tax=Buchnera aphidicola TaxID=9 RepID=UPI0031B85995